MGPPPAQETIRGKLVWQLGLVTQTHRVHQHVFNETQSLFDRDKLTILLHFNERNLFLVCKIGRNGHIQTFLVSLSMFLNSRMIFKYPVTSFVCLVACNVGIVATVSCFRASCHCRSVRDHRVFDKNICQNMLIPLSKRTQSVEIK